LWTWNILCVTTHFVFRNNNFTSVSAAHSGDRNPVEARFSAPIQTGPGVHPASCTMSTGFFPRVKDGRVVTLTPHPLLVPWSRKSRAIPLLSLWAVRPVQSLSACTRLMNPDRSEGLSEPLSGAKRMTLLSLWPELSLMRPIM